MLGILFLSIHFSKGAERVGMEQLFRVGVISSTHGLKGEVKVYPTTDDEGKFSKLKSVILDTGKEQINLEIQQTRFFKNMAILKFKGIDCIDDIEKYKGKPLFVTRENAVSLGDIEFYIADLIGLEVFSDDGMSGRLKDIIQTGANDVYIVDFDNMGEVLIPAIKDCILNVDIKKGRIDVHLMKGLI